MPITNRSPRFLRGKLALVIVAVLAALTACDQLATRPVQAPLAPTLSIEPCPDSLPDCYSPPPSFDNSAYGLQVWTEEEPAVWARANTWAEAANASWIRVPFDWDKLQPSGPAMDAAQVQRYRDFVDNATAHHLTVYPILMKTPSWVLANYPSGHACRTNAQCPPDPTSFMWWRMFVDSMVTLFPEIPVWGIWNEPNDTTFLPNAAASGFIDRVNLYGTLVAYAADAIQAHGKKVAGPELGTGSSTDANSPQSWFAEYMRRWGYRTDVMTVHKYDTGAGVVAAMREYGDTARFGPWPLWLTEVGIASATETDRARLLTDVYQGMASQIEPKWERTFFFAEYSGYQPDTSYEIIHDMFTTTPRPQLAYYCFQALASGQTPPAACQ